MNRLARALTDVTLALTALLAGVVLGAAPGEQVPVAAAQTARCGFILGFETLRGLVGATTVGGCLEDQHFVAGGNAQQRTTGGLLVWRKEDNWTAFTNGYQTWINGPFGLQDRLNTELFPWEALPIAASTTAAAATTPVSGPAPPGGATAAAGPAVSPSPTPAPRALPPGTAILVAAGDIAGCADPGIRAGADATARLVATVTADAPDFTVAVLGDNAYEDGAPGEYAACYDPTWGRYKARTRPAPGNHEYQTPGAEGYFGYFGGAAGDPDKGYYSYDLGAWHVVVLNSNCQSDSSCATGSPQEQWLRTDLAGHPAQCTLAYMHHPRFSSGEHGSSAETQPLWQALYDAHADLLLSGHDHSYERFTPQDDAGRADPLRGIREIVVGTGGRSLYLTFTPRPNSEVRLAGTYGVLRVDLRPTGYDWRFFAVSGSVLDSGSEPCR